MLGARVGACNTIKAFKLSERPNLQLYLDNDSTTMLNAAGTAAVLEQQIATWQDKSGNNRHMIQATDTKRPKRQVINSRNAVTFTKVIQSNLYNGYEIGSQTFTIVFVYNNSGTDGCIWDISRNVDPGFFIDWGTNNINVTSGSNSFVLPKNFNQGNSIVIGIINYGVINSTFNIYLESENGIIFNNNGSYFQNHSFNGGLSLGIYPVLPNLHYALEGQIYEMVIYNRSIKGGERTDIIKLLKEKYLTTALTINTIANLTLWLDTGSIILNDSNFPCSVNEKVKTWQDKSLSANHLTQAIVINQPTYRGSYIEFDNVEQNYMGSGYQIGTQDFTIISAHMKYANDSVVWNFAKNTAGNCYLDDTSVSIPTGLGTVNTIQENKANSIIISVVTYGTDVTIRRYYDMGTMSTYVATSSRDFTFDGGFVLGNSFSSFLSGRIYDIIVYNRVLTIAEINVIVNILRLKYF
jgi:hypothetical protein